MKNHILKIYSPEEIEAIRLQLAAITHLDGTPVFQVRIDPGLYGCFIKLANPASPGREGALYFPLLAAPLVKCFFCGETHRLVEQKG